MTGNAVSQSNETAACGCGSEGARAANNYLSAFAPGQENTEGSGNESVHSSMTAAVSGVALQRGAGALAPMAIAMPVSSGG